MNKYIFYIGKNDKDQRKQILSDREFLYYISSCFHNFTVTEALGYYTYEDGYTEQEKSLVVTVFNSYNDTDLKHIVGYLKTVLNQESIGVEIVNNCNINFM